MMSCNLQALLVHAKCQLYLPSVTHVIYGSTYALTYVRVFAKEKKLKYLAKKPYILHT